MANRARVSHAALRTPLTGDVGGSSLEIAFGAVSHGTTTSRKGVVAWAAFTTPSTPGAHTDLAITVSIGSAGTATAYGAASQNYGVGIDSIGQVGAPTRTAAGGFIYLFGDFDGTVFGASSTQVVLTAGSSGTTRAYGGAFVGMTLLVGSSGAGAVQGAASASFSFSADSAGDPRAVGASALPIALGVGSAGSFIPAAPGGTAGLSMAVVFNSTPGLIRAVASASLAAVFGVTSRPEGLRLISLDEDSLSLQVEDSVITLTLTPLEEQQNS